MGMKSFHLIFNWLQNKFWKFIFVYKGSSKNIPSNVKIHDCVFLDFMSLQSL